MSVMERLGIEELNWREGESQLQLKRASQHLSTNASNDGEWSHRPASPLPANSQPLPSQTPKRSEFRAPWTRLPENESTSLVVDPEQVVHSPMVGTLYLTPAPDRPPFVKVGDEVKEESVVCIIEAMKVMNEIRAPATGKVVEIFMESGSPVEFGSHLMRIA